MAMLMPMMIAPSRQKKLIWMMMLQMKIGCVDHDNVTTSCASTGENRKKSGYALVGCKEKENNDRNNDCCHNGNAEDDPEADADDGGNVKDSAKEKLKCIDMEKAAATKATPNPVASAMPSFHAPVTKECGTKNACCVGHWLPLIDKFEI